MVLERIRVVLKMIRFEHSVFALPFALLSALVAARGLPSLHQIVWIVLACVFARTAAMSFNRLADLQLDTMNPRTHRWALPAGLVSRGFVAAFVIINSLLFIIAAAELNRLALALSPLALIILFGYSYTKRFTYLSHVILGLALGIAPMGAWIAVRGEFAIAPAVLGVGVLLWTCGFDILYSLQDIEFDRRAGLFSIPQRFGVAAALTISRLAHGLAFVCFLAVYALAKLGWLYLAGTIAVGLLLVYEHSLVKPSDFSRINTAFFTVNGVISIFLFLCGLGDFLLDLAG
jgi:4-hydroxybenzoate polyprenyltransferase